MAEDSPAGTEQPAESVESVVQRCRGELVGRARKLLARASVPPSQADAEDIVQAAVTKALTSTVPIREPRAYLYKLVERQVVEEGRERQRRYEQEFCRGRDLLEVFPQLDADHARLVDNRLAVHAALGELPPEQRKAVYAHKALGYSQRETAELLDKRPGTIGIQVAQAMSMLTSVIGVMVVVCSWLFARSLLVVAGLANTGSSEPGATTATSWGVLAAVLSAIAALAPALWSAWRNPKVRRFLRLPTLLPRPKKMHCESCEEQTTHRQLTEPEMSWAARFPQMHYTEAQEIPFWVCLTSDCRAVRHQDEGLPSGSSERPRLPGRFFDPLDLREENGTDY